jgi:hypothetical protein
MSLKAFNPADYPDYQQDFFPSRWLRPVHWQQFITRLEPRHDLFNREVIGQSVEGREITCWRWGVGKKKLLLWSQMHGNEPTGTMALADLFGFLNEQAGKYKELRDAMYSALSVCIVPILNPDGAEVFTRQNAWGVDINRDARRQQTPEMQALQKLISKINPHFTFNLHDQRNIFSAGAEKRPATISFLAASGEESRKITSVRKAAMSLIVSMQKSISGEIPGCIGRYTDEYYPRAIGDYLHSSGIPCILIESGASSNDPLRNTARKMNFLALLEAFRTIITEEVGEDDVRDYQDIPENQKLFYDLILRGCEIEGFGSARPDLALLIDERPDKSQFSIRKRYIIKEIGDLNYHYGLNEHSGVEVHCESKLMVDAPANLSVFQEGKLICHFKDGYLYEEH